MSHRQYDPQQIETKWQDYWENHKAFTVDLNSDKEKYYVLAMFPYPSGTLHMGHVINYTISDVIVRFNMMQGKEVLSPIGWDSFGLPAENAAIKNGIHPEDNTRANIDKMRIQMKRAGWGFDWSREIATSHPEYYKWTQWLFLQFFKHGLVEQKRAPVNWCPHDQTTLANEQVIDGCCERCGTPVIQRDLEQWFFKMSNFGQKLLDNHSKLPQWPERVIKMQQEWIGRSEGALIYFTIAETGDTLPIFTTRPDTIFGVTYLVLAPEHPLIEKLLKGTSQEEDVMSKVQKMRALGTSAKERVGLEKEGVSTGFSVINPLNGDKVPLWVANFALMSYGTGAVMSVPAHDQRDFEFSKKYGLPIKVVIQPREQSLDSRTMSGAFVDDGIQVNSGQFDGMQNKEAMGAIINWIEQKKCGKRTINYSLRDWLLSRQRYWGVPIPIIHCEQCGKVPVPDEQLPVRLPRDVAFKPTGESPLLGCKTFMNVKCPKCGNPARRDPDTMDTFVDSSWYMFRYISPRCKDEVFNKDDVHKWAPIDFYVGGIEHATMHLIYTRFFTMVMNQLGLLNFDEPAVRLFCQGMVCKMAYFCPELKWVQEEDVKDGICVKSGKKVVAEVAKMSKTKLNTVSPDDIINRYGADTMRFYMLADTPPDRDQIWDDKGVLAAHRFLRRLWDLVIVKAEEISRNNTGDSQHDKRLLKIMHNTIKNATNDFSVTLQFNTAIARVYELVNAAKASENVSASALRHAIETILKLLNPIIPHICEELWQILGNTASLLREPWPLHDESALIDDEITIVIQVNSKLRSKLEVPANISQEEIERLALADEKIQSYIDGKQILKKIVVPNKLVNIVVK